MKILANDGISPAGLKVLTEAGYQVRTEKVEQDQIAAFMNEEGFEILLVRSATVARKEMIDQIPNLKLIGRGGVGMDNIDVEYARSKGIHVINTPASSSQSVAELVMGKMFSISRYLNDSYKNIENGDFASLKKQYGKGVELRGKKLAIFGFGRIGQSVASYAIGCGMEVYPIGRRNESVTVKLGNIQGFGELSTKLDVSTDMEGILSKVDYLSIHVPKQPNGDAVIGQAEFNMMKPGIRIVNAARGGVIDESALLEALENGKVASAGLDVFENEPSPRKELLSHKRIAATPHIGAATLEAQDRIGEELAEIIISTFGKH